MNDNPEAIADAENTADNISFEELIAQRTQKFLQPEDEEIISEESDDDVSEDLPESDETEQDEELVDDETEDGEEEPDIDLLSLSPEQLQELARKSKSRLLHRIGELTAKNKALEESVQNVQRDTKPLLEGERIPEPIAKLESVDQLTEEYSRMQKVVEETDRILEEYEDYGVDDVIVLDDREFTKRQIRQANRNARDSMTKWLPARNAELVRVGQRQLAEKQFTERLEKEIPEIVNEESELAVQYKALLGDPLIDQVKKHVPDLAPQLPYILGHALKSILRTQKVQTNRQATGKTAQAKVPSSPFGAATGKSALSGKKRAIESAKQQLNKSHSVEDWIAARVAMKS